MEGEQPYLGDLRSPWLLTTYYIAGMILQVHWDPPYGFIDLTWKSPLGESSQSLVQTPGHQEDSFRSLGLMAKIHLQDPRVFTYILLLFYGKWLSKSTSSMDPMGQGSNKTRWCQRLRSPKNRGT